MNVLDTQDHQHRFNIMTLHVSFFWSLSIPSLTATSHFTLLTSPFQPIIKPTITTTLPRPPRLLRTLLLFITRWTIIVMYTRSTGATHDMRRRFSLLAYARQFRTDNVKLRNGRFLCYILNSGSSIFRFFIHCNLVFADFGSHFTLLRSRSSPSGTLNQHCGQRLF